ncbi:MAG: DUF1080 domain-containing protein [Opitutaceae bacterium]|nr:DUF1080 domain-containing protein [Opitutaceae bacterium]
MLTSTRFVLCVFSVLIGGMCLPLPAQPSPAPYVPKQSDRPVPVGGDESGFRPIFDGRTLDGWAGNPVYWRVEDGCIVGEITPETLVKSNTFIIWQGGQPANFELKLEYRISEKGNSGINYRSALVPVPATPENKFAMRGYQCDLDGRNRYSGNNYEERGRLFLAERGQLTRVTGGRPPTLVSRMGEEAELAGAVSPGWNEVHLIIRGNTLVHMINGRVMSITIDDDAPNRPERGSIGMQVHVGPPMKVEFRNIRLKTW